MEPVQEPNGNTPGPLTWMGEELKLKKRSKRRPSIRILAREGRSGQIPAPWQKNARTTKRDEGKINSMTADIQGKTVKKEKGTEGCRLVKNGRSTWNKKETGPIVATLGRQREV